MTSPDQSHYLKTGIQILTTLLIILYPLILFLGLKHWSINTIAPLLLVIFSLRFFLIKNKLALLAWFSKAVTFFVLVLVLSGWILKNNGLLLFYPVTMNAVMLILFAYSLWSPPSVIERLARLQEPDLPEEGVQYTKKVTFIWCLFFVVNGSIALWTCLKNDMALWTLYNGVISYILMGLLFAGEWIVRKWVQTK